MGFHRRADDRRFAGFLLTAILAWGVCRMLGDENCRAWRGQFALFNGMIILCVTGKGVFGLVSYYLK